MHDNDMYAQNQLNLRESHADKIAAFNAACRELGIGEGSDGARVSGPRLSHEPEYTRPRFEAECTIKDGQYVEIKVRDYSVSGSEGHTARSGLGRSTNGGTEDARRLADAIRARLS